MLISESWLREWVSPDIDTQALADKLTMAGLEVETVEAQEAIGGQIVIGEVVAMTSHPDADKLNVCQVNIGSEASAPLTIVCGADNAAEGIRVPVALVGATLPNGMRIEAREVRGVASNGMLCSASELGLEEKSSGLLLLDQEAPTGARFDEYLKLDDQLIDVDLTPNRGDCLSISGVAREVAVLTGCQLNAVAIAAVPAEHDDVRGVTLEALEHCARYAGRVIRGVKPKQKTPDWLREKLRRSGVRSISPIVDITNYVMLELGQPMHAFDASLLDGDIRVRMAQSGETLTLLDGRTLALEPDMLVIGDQKQAVALAGIMGGENSEVSEDTTDILLEAAYFSPLGIAGRARALGMQTDASHRFERGVDATGQLVAIERATQLLLEIVGGEPGPVFEASDDAHLPKQPVITLRAQKITSMLGVEVKADDIDSYFSGLGFEAERTDEGWQVRTPSWRFDLSGEHDLIEEVGRVIGFDRVPPVYPKLRGRVPDNAETAVEPHALRQWFAQRGHYEVVSYSFVDPDEQALLQEKERSVALGNPIASNMSVMRTSLMVGLLGAARTNLNRQIKRMNLFELGRVFERDSASDTGAVEHNKLAFLRLGAVTDKSWAESERSVDFFDLKGDLEALFEAFRIPGALEFLPSESAVLHPGRSAKVLLGDRCVGELGQCHPAITERFDIDVPAYFAELDMRALNPSELPDFVAISRFPATTRDLSIVVPEAVSAGEILKEIRNHSGKLLKDVALFDNYQGSGVESGAKSLAFGLVFQSREASLGAGEVDAMLGDLLSRLSEQFGAQLRA